MRFFILTIAMIFINTACYANDLNLTDLDIVSLQSKARQGNVAAKNILAQHAREQETKTIQTEVVPGVLSIITTPPVQSKKASADTLAMIEAAKNNQKALVQELLNKGADANGVSASGVSGLKWAAIRGHVEIVQLLLDSGANINAMSSGATPLMAAALQGNSDIVQLLVDRGADVDARDRQGITALKMGAAHSSVVAILLPLARDNDLTPRNKKRDPGAPSLLLKGDKGDVLAQHKLGYAYYHGWDGADQDRAESYYWFSICDYMNGAKKQISLSDAATSVHDAMRYSFQQECLAMKAETAKELHPEDIARIDQRISAWQSAHPLQKSEDKDPAAQQLAQRLIVEATGRAYDISGINALIQAGASTKAKEYTSGLFLKVSGMGRIDILDALIKAGSDINETDISGNSALSMAITQNQTKTAQWLIGKGINIEERNIFGHTPVMQAAERGNLEITQELVKAGAKVDAVDDSKYGISNALDLAIRNKHSKVIDFLVKQGLKSKSPLPVQQVCAQDVQTCADGTQVSRVGLYCEFSACPATPQPSPQKDGMAAYPDVDISASKAAVKALQSGVVDEKNKMIALVKAYPENYTPPVLKTLSEVLFHQYKDEDALFWDAAANYRAAYDRKICPVKKGFTSFFIFDFPSPSVRIYTQANQEKVKALLARVKEWAEKTPYNYDHRWTRIHNYENGGTMLYGHAQQPTEKEPCLPQDQWPTIETEFRASYFKGALYALQDIQPDGSSKSIMKAMGVMPSTPQGQALLAAINAKPYDFQKVQDLIKQGANVNETDRAGNTALMWAAMMGRLDSLNALIKAGADISKARGTSETAVMIAASKGKTDCVEALIKAGADIKARASGSGNALMLAAWSGHTDTVQSLIKAGAAINDTGSGNTTALMFAAKGPHPDTVKALIDAGAKLDFKDKRGQTALTLAQENGNKEVINIIVSAMASSGGIPAANQSAPVQIDNVMQSVINGKLAEVQDQIKAGADINKVDGNGYTALMMAIMSGRLDIVKALVDARAKVDVRAKDGQTALLLAVNSQHNDNYLEIVNAVMSGLIKSDVNFKERGMGYEEALIVYVNRNVKPEFVKKMISAGVDVNAKDDIKGSYVLTIAAREASPDIIKALLAAGASVNAQNERGLTALTASVFDLKYAGTVRILIDAGADIDAKNAQGETALSLAQKRGHANVELLLKKDGSLESFYKAEIDARGGIDKKTTGGMTLLMKAAQDADAMKVRVLLDKNADVNATDDNGWTALMKASKSAEVLKMLLDKGAQVNAMSKDGRTALVSAVDEGNIEAVQALISAGANINPHSSDDKVFSIINFSPLMAAAFNGNAEMARLLISHGADKNEKMSSGGTPLRIAVTRGNIDIVRVLIESGVDAHAKDSNGNTALKYTEDGQYRYIELKALLEQYAKDSNGR